MIDILTSTGCTMHIPEETMAYNCLLQATNSKFQHYTFSGVLAENVNKVKLQTEPFCNTHERPSNSASATGNTEIAMPLIIANAPQLFDSTTMSSYGAQKNRQTSWWSHYMAETITSDMVRLCDWRTLTNEHTRLTTNPTALDPKKVVAVLICSDKNLFSHADSPF